MIYTKIFYKVIDGFEYQLINLNDLWECLENVGFPLTQQEKICVEQFCDVILTDVIKVRKNFNGNKYS